MSAAALIGDQIVLEELYDETYIPTEQGKQGRETWTWALGIAEYTRRSLNAVRLMLKVLTKVYNKQIGM